MDLLGQHEVSFDAIRTLAIEFGALHIAVNRLLIDRIQVAQSGRRARYTTS